MSQYNEFNKSSKLVAPEGMMLTNGIAYGKVICLGCNDDVNNWYEITEEKFKQNKANEQANFEA